MYGHCFSHSAEAACTLCDVGRVDEALSSLELCCKHPGVHFKTAAPTWDSSQL